MNVTVQKDFSKAVGLVKRAMAARLGQAVVRERSEAVSSDPGIGKPPRGIVRRRRVAWNSELRHRTLKDDAQWAHQGDPNLTVQRSMRRSGLALRGEGPQCGRAMCGTFACTLKAAIWRKNGFAAFGEPSRRTVGSIIGAGHSESRLPPPA
jgi:hypothetical protein